MSFFRRGQLWSPNEPIRPDRFPFFYGWLIVVFATLGICASMPGQTIGVSVFTTRLSEALALDSLQLSIAYMLGTLLSAFGLNAGGRFFDYAGARKALVLSVAALALTLFYMSGVETWSEWLAWCIGSRAPLWLSPFVVLTLGFAMLRFTGQGMVTLSSRAMLGKWFKHRRGTVTALSGAVVAFTFSGAPICFEYLIRHFSWQGGWQVMGAVWLLVLVPLIWVFARDNPEECGLEMDGGLVLAQQKSNPDTLIHHDFTLVETRKTFAFWAFSLMFALNALVITGYSFHIIAIGNELSVSTEYILGLFIPTAFVSILAGFGIARLTDLSFVRIKYLLCIMAVSSASGFFTLALGKYPEISYLHILGFGISGGCFGSLSAIIYPRFFGRQYLGAISGLYMTVLVVASAVGPFLMSGFEAMTGSYRFGFWWAGLVAGILAIAALKADNPQRNLEN